MKIIYYIKGVDPPLHLLCPISSPLVYGFADMLMRCLVTMVSNVSDSSDAWPGKLLHAHVIAFTNATQSGPYTLMYMHTHTAYKHKHLERYGLF